MVPVGTNPAEQILPCPSCPPCHAQPIPPCLQVSGAPSTGGGASVGGHQWISSPLAGPRGRRAAGMVRCAAHREASQILIKTELHRVCLPTQPRNLPTLHCLQHARRAPTPWRAPTCGRLGGPAQHAPREHWAVAAAACTLWSECSLCGRPSCKAPSLVPQLFPGVFHIHTTCISECCMNGRWFGSGQANWKARRQFCSR